MRSGRSVVCLTFYLTFNIFNIYRGISDVNFKEEFFGN